MTLRFFLLILATIAAGGILTAAFLDRQQIINSENLATCTKIHRLDSALVGLVAANSRPRVLKSLAYYRTHPADLRRVEVAARHEIAVLEAADCTP